MYDVTIIGAGVVGGMIARKLSAYKLNICVLEKENDVAMGATKANSAIVHAGFDAKEGSLKAQLNVRGSKMMESVTKELGVKYKRNGSLVVGFSQEDRIVLQELKERGEKNGVEKLRILEKEELQKIEPNISPNAECALYAPTGAIVCPYELTVAAIGNAMDNGVDLKLCFDVKEIKGDTEGFVIYSDKSSVKTKYIINAAGLYADKIANMIGDNSFKIHPRRGEYILLDKKCGKTVSQTIFRTPSNKGKGILVSPTVDGNLLCGPTAVDIENKEDKAVTAEGISAIINEMKQTVASIEINKTITSFCGLRAVGDTGDFIINSPKNGMINVAAIESPGLSASPAIAEYVEKMLVEQGLELNEKDNYNPQRKPMNMFKEMTLDEKNEIIKRDKRYGKIVCRCEGITEGEIVEVIHQNPRPTDLDGIKRRTRAQMGRCQGGFCSPYIIEILARELNVNYEDITKFGGESYINTKKTKERN